MRDALNSENFKNFGKLLQIMPTPTIKKRSRTRPIPEINICAAAELSGRSENNNNYLGQQRGEGIKLLNPHKYHNAASSKDVVDSGNAAQVCVFLNK